MSAARDLWIVLWLYGLRLLTAHAVKRRLLRVAGMVRRPLRLYRRRWGIGGRFGGLKSRGLDFETMHLNIQRQISTQVGMLAIAYSLAHAKST